VEGAKEFEPGLLKKFPRVGLRRCEPAEVKEEGTLPEINDIREGFALTPLPADD
jgi:hypothetical protein